MQTPPGGDQVHLDSLSLQQNIAPVWLATKDVGELDSVQRDILDLYALDFAKYAPTPDIPKLRMIWNSIPSQLAKEHGKFV